MRHLVAQKIGEPDTCHGADRRKCVAAVVPGVGYDARTVRLTSHTNGIAIQDLFGDDRNCGGDQGDRARSSDYFSGQYQTDIVDAVGQNASADGDQGQADEDGGQGFVLAVSVVVAGVFGFGGDPGEDQHDDIGRQVRYRVHGIGDHGSASAEDAGREFQEGEGDIDDHSDPGYPVNFSGAFRGLIHVRLLFAPGGVAPGCRLSLHFPLHDRMSSRIISSGGKTFRHIACRLSYTPGNICRSNGPGPSDVPPL